MEDQNALNNLIQQLTLSGQHMPNVQNGVPPGFPQPPYPSYHPNQVPGAMNPNLYPPFPQVPFHPQPPMQFLASPQQLPVNFPSNPPQGYSVSHQRPTPQGMVPPSSPSPITSTTESQASILSDLLGLQPSESSQSSHSQISTPTAPILPLSTSPSPILPRIDLRGSSDNLKSPSGRKRQEDQPGIFLPSGPQIIHNMDPEALKKKTQSLEVTPITLYSSLDYTYQPGTTIAVNKTYICYIVRGDMIRVLNQKSASRGLLKGHTGAIVDLSFFRDDVDLLLSCCKDGNVFVWKLVEQADGNISHDIIFQIKGDKQVSVIRAVWHPLDETQFATAESDNSVKLWNRNLTSSNTIERQNSQKAFVALPENENVQGLVFAPAGDELAVATSNTVKFYQVDGSSTSLRAQFQPHDVQLSGITYVRGSTEHSLFITGALRNSDIKLWSLDTRNNSFVCLQNVCLVCSAAGESYFWNHFSLDATGSFLFVTNTREKTIHVLHLKTGADDVRFDYITEFVLDQPILSFVVTNHERSGKIHIGPGQDMQLYCVQTKAIQSYQVNSDQCYLASSNVNTPRERQSEIIQPVNKSEIAPQMPEEQVDILARLQSLAPKNAEPAQEQLQQQIHSENSQAPQVETTVVVPEQSISEPAVVTTAEEEVLEEQETQSTQPELMERKDEIAPANENVVSANETEESKIQSIGSPSTTPGKAKSRTRKRKPETKEEIQPESIPANNQPSQPKNKLDGKKLTILTRPKQDEKKDETIPSLPVPTVPIEQPVTSTPVTAPESSVNQATTTMNNNQLLAAFSALQKRINASMENTMQNQMEKLYNRLEAERKEREKQERERQEKLLAAVSQTVNQNLASHLEAIIKKEMQSTVMPTLLKSISQSMETTVLKLLQDNFKKLVVHVILPKLDTAIKETLGKHNIQDTVASEVNKQIELSIHQSLERNMQHLLEVAISQSLDQPVRESFLNCFQDLLIPSFERSCQAMFLQLNDAFQAGLADRTQKQGGYVDNRTTDPALTEQLKLAVSSLVETSATMSRAIVDTQNKILADYVDRRNTNLLQAPTTDNNNNNAPRASDTNQLASKDLQALIAQRKYEQAFATALSARNIDTLTWLISQLNPQEIFSQTPLPLSQYVLLSLIQQLGFDLSKDTKVKLNWLRESALVLNLKDAVISEHAPIILSKLLRNLEQHYPNFAETPNASSFKLLMHVINSLIK